MSAVTQEQMLRGGIGSGSVSVIVKPRRKERPPRIDPQEAVNDLVYLYGRNVVEWADWPELLAARGLVPSDVTPTMVSLADRLARERKDRPKPRLYRPVEVSCVGNGDIYPMSRGEGREALLEWVEEVKNMAARRGKLVTFVELMQLCSYRDKSLFGELFRTEVESEKEKDKVANVFAKTITRTNNTVGSIYGSRPTSQSGRINLVLSTEPKSAEEISELCGVYLAYVKAHLSYYFRTGTNVGPHLIRWPDGKWSLKGQ